MKKAVVDVVNLSMFDKYSLPLDSPQKSPFALLGLLPTYKIDFDLLDKHYFILQKELHPDRFVHGSSHELQTAEKMSSLVNEAYIILKDPCRRAKALLETKGPHLVLNDQDWKPDSDLLTTILEWRQQFDEAETDQQQTDFINIFQTQIKSCEDNFNNAWVQQDPQLLKKTYIELLYFTKTWNQLREESNVFHTFEASEQ